MTQNSKGTLQKHVCISGTIPDPSCHVGKGHVAKMYLRTYKRTVLVRTIVGSNFFYISVC